MMQRSRQIPQQFQLVCHFSVDPGANRPRFGRGRRRLCVGHVLVRATSRRRIQSWSRQLKRGR